MARILVRLVCGVALAFAAAGIVFVAGMRAKSPPVLDAVRRISRATKPLVLRTAGTPGTSVSVIRHVGRTTGRTYETPVTAVPTHDGFVIALPYGANTDWLRNVLISGTATITHDGTSHPVESPQVVATAAVQQHFSPSDQRAHRWFAVERCVQMRRVTGDAP